MNSESGVATCHSPTKVFDEILTADLTERAVALACRRTHAEVMAFTVAPPHPSPADAGSGHDWLVEFIEPPRSPLVEFLRALDETLCVLSQDYRTHRIQGVGVARPRLIELPAGTFDRWRRDAGNAGDSSGVPRVTADRAVASRRTRGPLITASACYASVWRTILPSIR